MLHKYLVLNTGDILRILRQYVGTAAKPPELPDDLIQEILPLFDQRHEAEIKVERALDQMMRGVYDYDYDTGISGDYSEFVDPTVVGCMAGLAAVIYQQLDLVGAYDGWGSLMYEYHPPTKDGSLQIVMRLKNGVSENMGITSAGSAAQRSGCFGVTQSSY